MTISLDQRSPRTAAFGRWTRPAWRLVPGLLLCTAIAAAAFGLQALETALFGRAWLEALVLAILTGAIVRNVWAPGARWLPGVAFSAKVLLEVAIVLLGAGLSASAILAVGPVLLLEILGVVALAILFSFGLGKLVGLPHRMAILIACGNSICGNSAIAAVAPVIGASGDEVATSIAFTAVLGVAVVLGLPVLAISLHMSPHGFGVLAGLTVYAVPQVLAATAPISSISAQVGTLVKLVRVLMLGPVVLTLALLEPGRSRTGAGGGGPNRAQLPKLHQMAPWFILGFLGLAAARSADLVPHSLISPASQIATWLTIISMAALGLGVDAKAVSRAGPRVIAVVTLSLLGLGAMALMVVYGPGLGHGR